MEMKKYKQAMQFLLKPKYLTKEFIVQYPEPSDEQQGAMDEVMPTPTPRMDNVMPSEPGMEDPRLRQIELADGGSVDYNRNPIGKNQYKTKSIEEIQQIIEANPNLNAKDLEGYGNKSIGRLLTRDDLKRAKQAGIKPGFSGKHVDPEKQRAKDLRRKEKIQSSQGQPISIQGSRTTGSNIEFGHVYPFSELAPQTNKMTGYIPADMNKKLTKFNNEAYKITQQQEDVIKNDPTNKRKIMELNAKAKLNSENAVKTLGPKYKGLIGHLRIDPDTLTVDKKGGDWQKSFAGISGEEIVYKDLSPKDRIDFEKQISNDLKNNPELVKQIQKAGFVCRKKIGGPIDLNCITKDLIKEGDKFKTGTPSQKKAAFNKFKNLSLKAGNLSLQAGKKALNILGAVLTPLIAYDTYTAYKEGKPVEEALEYGLLGTNIIGSVRDESKLTPQEREARGVKQQYEREQEDISGLSSDFYVPSNLSIDEATAVSKEATNRIAAERAAKEKQLAAQREYEGDPGIQDDSGLYAYGGRVGLEKGGDPKDKPILPINPMIGGEDPRGPLQDPGRRDVLKGMGLVGAGAAAAKLGLLGLGRVKKAIKAAKLVNVVKPMGATITKFPKWFPSLINRFRKEGKQIPIFKEIEVPLTATEYNKLSKEGAKRLQDHYLGRTENYIQSLKQEGKPRYTQIQNTDEIIGYEYQVKDLPGTLVREMDGEEITVYFPNAYGRNVEMKYIAPKVTVDMKGKKVKYDAEFEVNDAVPEMAGPEDVPDFFPGTVDNLDDVYGGASKIEQYATKAKQPRTTLGDEVVNRWDAGQPSMTVQELKEARKQKRREQAETKAVELGKPSAFDDTEFLKNFYEAGDDFD